MKRSLRIFIGLLTVALLINTAAALDITIQKNGYRDLFGGQVSGPGIGTVPLGTDTNDVFLSGLVAGATYTVDWFHNGGPEGSDFSFKVNAAGTGIELVSTSGYGAGGQQMVIGFTAGDTQLVLNAHSIIVNANNIGGQAGHTGYYYPQGGFAAYSVPPNAGPQTLVAIPGRITIDNLVNTGAGNEDYAFFVNQDGMLSALSGYDEYSVFSGNAHLPRSSKVHYVVEASTNILCCIGLTYYYTVFNLTSSVNPTSALPYIYQFDMIQSMGNGGHLFPDFGSNTVISANIMKSTNSNINVAGLPIVGDTSANDFAFRPRLRYTDQATLLGINDFYFWNTDGSNTVATAYVEGFFDGNIIPLNMRITATIVPEPTSLALALGGAIGLMRLRRR